MHECGAGYQSLYEVARSRGVTVKFWEPRYTGSKRVLPFSGFVDGAV